MAYVTDVYAYRSARRIAYRGIVKRFDDVPTILDAKNENERPVVKLNVYQCEQVHYNRAAAIVDAEVLKRKLETS